MCGGGGGGEAEKPLTFSGRVRERKEGKGELRMAFSHSVLLPVFLYRSTTRLFILFISLPSFHFLSLALTSGLDTPSAPTPTTTTTHPLLCPLKSPLTTLLQLSNALFGPFAVPCCCSPCEGCPPTGKTYTRTHTHTHTHKSTHTHVLLLFFFFLFRLQLFIICFARLSLTLCIC